MQKAPQPKLYNLRHPERTLLYQTIAEHYETWLELASTGQFDGQGDHRTPKPYIRQAFAKYLQCGIFAHGFARARCADCGHDFFVAFSCKGRGVCPSCNTRRMVETAAHLTDHVLPRLPVRQWVLSVPKRLRYFMQRDGTVLKSAPLPTVQAVPVATGQHAPALAGMMQPSTALPTTPEPVPPKRCPAHYLWAVLIARIYEVFPLLCPLCGGQMRIIAFITHSAISGKCWVTSGCNLSHQTSHQRVGRRCGRTVMRKWVKVPKSNPIGTWRGNPHQTMRSISASVGDGSKQ